MQKLLSRKLGLSLAAIAAIVLEIDDPVKAGVVGVVAAVYVIAQGLVDKAAAERVASAVEQGVAEGRKASEQ